MQRVIPAHQKGRDAKVYAVEGGRCGCWAWSLIRRGEGALHRGTAGERRGKDRTRARRETEHRKALSPGGLEGGGNPRAVHVGGQGAEGAALEESRQVSLMGGST